jgi:hypothetical protein
MHVVEVIEPPMLGYYFAVGVAAQCAPHAVLRLFALNPLPLGTYAHGREAETSDPGAAASLVALARVIDGVAVDQVAADAGFRITRVPEILKALV